MSANPITQKSVLRVLIAGFSLVILLLLASAFVGVTNVRSIRHSVAALVAEQGITTRLFGEIEREQAALNAIFYKLAGAPNSLDRQRVLEQLHEADLAIERVTQSASDAHTDRLWLDFQRAARDFSEEARRALAEPDTEPTEDLFDRHQHVISTGDRLSTLSYQKSLAAQRQIEQRSTTLMRNSALLLGACLLLALLCAVLTMRLATDLIKQMEQQSEELSRVSWHMLENQETIARRFSHELHDELGQSLTAVKANLLSLQNGRAMARVQDCIGLVDEAIRNVRELAQLMRPTILDDFGLDAGLRWLGEGFHQRTSIQVDYRSNFEGRLSDETETHLFRIAQEALTNAARHSGASRVEMELRRQNGRIGLLLSDNGRGMEASGGPPGGMGITGMRARARISGGEMSLDSKLGGGVRIEVWLPAYEHETKDSHTVGR